MNFALPPRDPEVPPWVFAALMIMLTAMALLFIFK